eukprot:4286972-Lingulodinium_polyedra.AAC.1
MPQSLQVGNHIPMAQGPRQLAGWLHDIVLEVCQASVGSLQDPGPELHLGVSRDHGRQALPHRG